MKNATEEELTKLMNYPNGAVKTTAYEALIRKARGDQFDLLYQALIDTTTFINYRMGCIGFTMMIGEYLVEQVVPISDRVPPPLPEVLEKYNLSEEEIDTLRELYRMRVDRKQVYYLAKNNN